MINRRSTLIGCASSVIAIGLAARRGRAQDSTLFGQSASALFERSFPDTALSWLLADARANIVTERWPALARPVAPGSLVKPFLAVAWSDQKRATFPVFSCRGTVDHCWLPTGHGLLTLPQALAQSCNAYFLELATRLDPARTRILLSRLGLHVPQSSLAPADMIGLTDVWREPPLSLVQAYFALLADRTLSVRSEIVTGLALSVREGTARAAALSFGSLDLLAKTGTAPCSHVQHATADGFALLLYPSTTPRFMLLAREHGATGALTARQAGAMLRALELLSA